MRHDFIADDEGWGALDAQFLAQFTVSIECISHFDNSAFNPFNPDASATVRNGPQTHNEMMESFVFYTLDDENLNLTIDPGTGRVVER